METRCHATLDLSEAHRYGKDPSFSCFAKCLPTAVRYHCMVEGRTFDFYVPHLMLPPGASDVLQIGIARCKDEEPLLFFPPEVVSGEPRVFCFNDQKVNSRTYVLYAERQEYSLYVPNDVFGGKRAPESLVVQAAIPRE